ncbi:MAG: desulfoferrodoxin [Intestinimonas sp.]|jgi:superoxide reductase|nr:desulfoferrodoxin [Intestinimonas sp.]
MDGKRFFICKHCGNLIGMIHASGVPVVCCGEPMTELVPGSVDASAEKHVPVVSVSGNLVTVTVGSTPHPMEEKHFIQWIYLETEQGGQRKCLKPGAEPRAVFALDADRPVAAYAYCNLHGLWKKEI